jgi:hypothetical protein
MLCSYLIGYLALLVCHVANHTSTHSSQIHAHDGAAERACGLQGAGVCQGHLDVAQSRRRGTQPSRSLARPRARAVVESTGALLFTCALVTCSLCYLCTPRLTHFSSHVLVLSRGGILRCTALHLCSRHLISLLSLHSSSYSLLLARPRVEPWWNPQVRCSSLVLSSLCTTCLVFKSLLTVHYTAFRFTLLTFRFALLYSSCSLLLTSPLFISFALFTSSFSSRLRSLYFSSLCSLIGLSSVRLSVAPWHSLHSIHNVSLLSVLTFCPQVELQAIGRAHRIGQKRAVTAYRYITEDTIEERMLELQVRTAIRLFFFLTAAVVTLIGCDAIPLLRCYAVAVAYVAVVGVLRCASLLWCARRGQQRFRVLAHCFKTLHLLITPLLTLRRCTTPTHLFSPPTHTMQDKKQLIFDGAVNSNAASMAQLTQEDLQFLFGG